MTNEEMIPLFALLRAMPSVTAWTDGHRQLYAIVLCDWPAELGRRVLEAATKNEEWRPAPAKLRKVAVRLAAPYPDCEAVYAEIMHKAQSIGTYGRPDPLRPNTVFDEGAPSMSHPLVSQVIASLGGWLGICSGEAQMQEGLRKQVRAAHESPAAQWEARVLEQLPLSCEQRDPRLFHAYRSYALPAGYVPPVCEDLPVPLPAVEPPQEEDKRRTDVPMPENVARMLQEAGFDAIGRRLNKVR